MATKVADVTVKVGSYTDKEGNTKGRYENVGAKWENNEGGSFITLKRTFSPAGVPNPDGKDSIILSIFPLKDKEEKAKTTSNDQYEE